jgi:hypothetical protein
MNESQKKVLLGSLGAFFLSVLYVPECWYLSNGNTTHEGWTFIWDITFDLNTKLLLIEWVAIAVVGGGLFFYFKDK